jgi:hypothetical protein
MEYAVSYNPPAGAAGVQRTALIVGVVGLVLCAVGFAGSRVDFFRAYLLGYLFWVGLSVGSLAVMMIGHLSGGAWNVVSRRVLEAASRTLPFMAILFVPIALGLHDLYLWADPGVVAGDAILLHKQPYLNVPFFLVRAVLYFVIWSAMGTPRSGACCSWWARVCRLSRSRSPSSWCSRVWSRCRAWCPPSTCTTWACSCSRS